MSEQASACRICESNKGAVDGHRRQTGYRSVMGREVSRGVCTRASLVGMIAARADVVWFMVLASRASRNASRSKAAALAAAAGFAPWFASGDMARGYLGSVGVNLRARGQLPEK